jgi:hypothetical protein
LGISKRCTEAHGQTNDLVYGQRAGGGLPDGRRKRDGTGRGGGYVRRALLGAVILERAIERAAVR